MCCGASSGPRDESARPTMSTRTRSRAPRDSAFRTARSPRQRTLLTAPSAPSSPEATTGRPTARTVRRRRTRRFRTSTHINARDQTTNPRRDPRPILDTGLARVIGHLIALWRAFTDEERVARCVRARAPQEQAQPTAPARQAAVSPSRSRTYRSARFRGAKSPHRRCADGRGASGDRLVGVPLVRVSRRRATAFREKRSLRDGVAIAC